MGQLEQGEHEQASKRQERSLGEASGSGRGLAVGGDGVDVVEADVGAIEAVRLVYFGNVFGFRECDVDALEMRC